MTQDTDEFFTGDEFQWMRAICEWQRGDCPGRADKLAVLINAMALPDFAKEFLVDLASGTVKPLYAGHPPSRTGQEERERTLIFETFAAWEDLKHRHEPGPRESAIALVAERHGLSGDTLRGIVETARASGLTLRLWRTYIGPSRPMGE